MCFISNKIVSEVISITPALAYIMLQTSDGNRKIRVSGVRALAGAMKRGEWQITNQGIGFDKAGHLKDGHHRLNAIILSGETVPMLVCRGMDIDSYEVIDSGIGRTTADRMDLESKYVDALRLATVIAFSSSYPTVAQIKRLWDSEFGLNLGLLVDHCPSIARFYSTAAIKTAATILMMFSKDKSYVLGQYKALCHFDTDQMSPCSLALVKRVSTSAIDVKSRSTVLAAGLKVFNEKNKYNSKLFISAKDIENAPITIREKLQQLF